MSRHDKRSATLQARTVRHRAAFLEQLKKTPVVQLAAEKVGTGRTTVYNWRERDKNFADEMDKALDEGKLLVNDVAESQLMAAIRERNMTAIIFWLKHHHPSYTTKVEINATIKDDYELTSEQKTLIREALRLAALPRPGELSATTVRTEEIEHKVE